jgi:hypothetical protein
MRTNHIITTAIVVLALPLGMLALAEEEPTVSTPDDLAWMAGTWRSEEGPMHFEEHWTAPWGGGLYAVSRGLSDGETTLVELSEITTTDAGLVLRLRHFQPGLKPWESEKDGPLEWQLEELAENRAVFVDEAQDFPKRVIYERKADVLHAILEGERDGAPVRMAFELPLVK